MRGPQSYQSITYSHTRARLILNFVISPSLNGTFAPDGMIVVELRLDFGGRLNLFREIATTAGVTLALDLSAGSLHSPMHKSGKNIQVPDEPLPSFIHSLSHIHLGYQ